MQALYVGVLGCLRAGLSVYTYNRFIIFIVVHLLVFFFYWVNYACEIKKDLIFFFKEFAQHREELHHSGWLVDAVKFGKVLSLGVRTMSRSKSTRLGASVKVCLLRSGTVRRSLKPSHWIFFSFPFFSFQFLSPSLSSPLPYFLSGLFLFLAGVGCFPRN